MRSRARRRAKRQTFLAGLFVATVAAIGLALFAGIVFVAIHFLIKYW